MDMPVIGLPRAMLWHRYGALWQGFLESLGCECVTSGESSRVCAERGASLSCDESCLPSKLFIGHVAELKDKCDAILIPRVASYGNSDNVCMKFCALYDIAANTFPGIRLLSYDLDRAHGHGEFGGFVGLGAQLGVNAARSAAAYARGQMRQRKCDTEAAQAFDIKLRSPAASPKILFVAHLYNTRDAQIGEPVIRRLEALGATVLRSADADRARCLRSSYEEPSTLMWRFNREMTGAVRLYAGQADGIVLLSAFPCGPDSLVNELIIRRMRGKPVIHIAVDELQSENGLQTRLESFMDMIETRRP